MPARVTDDDAAEDALFFAGKRDRRYRLRETTDRQSFVIVRKVRTAIGCLFLRTHLNHLPDCVEPDSEAVAEALWWTSVYADADPRLRRAAMCRARRNGGAG